MQDVVLGRLWSHFANEVDWRLKILAHITWCQLITSVCRPETYHAAVSWWNSNNVRGAGISLCVATKADKLMDGEFVERPGWLEMARQWCSSELIEYIEVCVPFLEAL